MKKVQSRKAKGRNLQKWTRERLIEVKYMRKMLKVGLWISGEPHYGKF